MKYDFIFVGAGPAGLTGSIYAARSGKTCLVLEKKKSLDLNPRGETLRFRPILDDVLGKGAMEELRLSKTSIVEYYPPKPDESEKIQIHMQEQNIVFDWAGLMQAFKHQIDSLDIDLKMEAEVIDTIQASGVVNGVLYKDAEGKEVSVNADVVFGCDGHKSIIGKKAGVNYQYQNYPIVKALYKNVFFDTRGFKFFIIPADAMAFEPTFPPAILFLFPRDGKNCEAGIMVMAKAGTALGYKMPTGQELIRVWKQAVKKYPVLNDMLKNASVELLEATEIPMTGPMDNVIPQKGVILIGDAAGFVEIQGGSGLVSSMECSKFWVTTILEEQNNGSDANGDLWSDVTVKKMTQEYYSSGIFKHIKNNAEISNANFDAIFLELQTVETIIKNWDMIESVLRQSMKID